MVDGYNAPVSAGNFVDLCLRKFYDNMTISRADGFVVQFGDPEGPAEGFVDPETKEIRRIPFEVRAAKDKVTRGRASSSRSCTVLSLPAPPEHGIARRCMRVLCGAPGAPCKSKKYRP